MKIQIHSYFHIPHGSVPIISTQWALELAEHHDVRVNNYTPYESRFPQVDHLMGRHRVNEITEAHVGIYFGYPSYQQTTGGLATKSRYKVGVFFCEARLAEKEEGYLRGIVWNKLVVPSRYCKKLFEQTGNMPADKITVVNHGLEEIYLQNGPAEKGENFTFLYVFGNSLADNTLVRKNLMGLLGAFTDYLKSHPQDRLLIKTTSNIQADITKLEAEHKNVKFEIRHMSTAQLRDLYRSAHVYVNPSKAEGFGMTALEAMSCGLPVVSAIHTGLAEFLTPMNCIQIECEAKDERYISFVNDGFVKQVTAPKICRAMLRARAEYDRLKVLAEQHVKNIREEFGWPSVLKPFLGWLNTLKV